MEIFWSKPAIRSVGFYSDSSIYSEVLEIARRVDFFTKNDLQEHLVNYVKGLTYKDKISDTGLNNLLKELYSFNWIQYYTKHNGNIDSDLFNRNSASLRFSITSKGITALENFYKNKDLFFDEIIAELYKLYTLPAWFIQRLWDLNPQGQGVIIIPSPSKNWNPAHKDWSDNKWNSELSSQLKITYEKIMAVIPQSFPIKYEIWLNETILRWNEIATTKPRTDKEAKHVFTPRKRLAMAMKESAIRILFSNTNPLTHKNDFENNNSPLLPRIYSYWCSRLEEIGLLNYSDYNPNISGRIIYPISSFNPLNIGNPNFRVIENVRNPNGDFLVLHRPKWEEYRQNFYDTLYEEYKKVYLKIKSLYVSIQDVRDEVCRILRLSNYLFDRFLEYAANETFLEKTSFRIAIETDVREDQRKSLQRKPVYFNNNIVSLIAITDK